MFSSLNNLESSLSQLPPLLLINRFTRSIISLKIDLWNEIYGVPKLLFLFPQTKSLLLSCGIHIMFHFSCQLMWHQPSLPQWNPTQFFVLLLMDICHLNGVLESLFFSLSHEWQSYGLMVYIHTLHEPTTNNQLLFPSRTHRLTELQFFTSPS